MAPLEREPVSGCMDGGVIYPLSPATTEETINKILSCLEITFSLERPRLNGRLRLTLPAQLLLEASAEVFPGSSSQAPAP